MRPVIILLAILGILSVAPAASAQNLLKDSGFESPVIPAGSFSETFTAQQRIGAWTVIGNFVLSGAVTLVSGSYQQDGLTFNAHSGNQYLDLGPATYNNSGASGVETEQGVAQTAATTPGANYILSFWLGSVYDTINGISDMSMVDVYINGYRTASMIETGKSGSKKQIWHQYSVTFTASSSETTVMLMNGPQFIQNDAIDDVELVPAQ